MLDRPIFRIIRSVAEYLQFGDSDAFLAEYLIVNDGVGLLAEGQIYAAFGRSDEMMALVAEGLTRKAVELGKPITHEFVATTDQARALIKRTEGYVFIEYDHKGHPVYRKTFIP